MKLYLSPYACSRAVHIAIHEAGLPHTSERVDLRSHQTASGTDYYTINPKGYVPTLELDNGERLTEVAVLLRYVADQAPEKALAPAHGTLERYRLEETLNFIATEVHKGFAPLFNPATPDAYKVIAIERLGTRFALLNERLSTQPYLMGASYTIADAYLFTVLGWAGMVKIDLAPYPALVAFLARVGDRPAVQAALTAES